MTLQLRGIDRHFGRHHVLKGIDLDVDGHVALTGANGSGKTTLLRIAAGILRSPGSATIDGRSVHHADARATIGFLGQEPALYDDLRPSEHLRWWSRVQQNGLAPAAARDRVQAAGIPDRPARTLSRGQRQRLAIALAFCAAPRVLLLDEPTNALDKDGLAWFDGLLSAHDGPALVAWHDTARAAQAGRVVRIVDGVLEAA